MTPSNRVNPVPRQGRWFLGLFIVVGAVLICVGFWNVVRSVRSEFWPTAEGVILSAKMESHRGQKGGTTYSASMGYDYVVAGSHYDGSRFAIGAMSASGQYAQGILDRYPVGKKVQVYYSPGDPQDSVLEPGIHGGTGICFGVGIVFMLAGMMFRQGAKTSASAAQNAASGMTGRVAPGTQNPPLLMGVIFILMGSFVAIGATTSGGPKWVVWTIGGFFILAGLFLLKKSLEKDEVD
jgi:hypothetical protein